ncbi:MAG: hypothetical protein ABF289_17030 [Clostridiales bacterium]
MNFYKLKLMILILTMILFLFSCDKINISSENSTNSKTDTKETNSAPKDDLTIELESTSKTHLEELNLNNSLFSTKEIVEIINKYASTIEKTGTELGLNYNLIKSIIFREQLLFNFDDYFADSLVENYYKEKDENTEDVNNKTDSSTGLGQIFAKTAISAENTINKSEMSIDNSDDIKDMWFNLQNDETNIYYIGLVLKEKVVNNNIDLSSNNPDSLMKLFEKYNGNGDEAVQYGNQTYDYYTIFEKYK